MLDVLGFILGGGRGQGLYPLTKFRSAPAVPVAGKYRLIDIPISNCINSGMHRLYVLTQFLAVSLHRHIATTYKFAPFSKGFVEVLAAQQTNEAADWYQGTADALRQNQRYLTGDSSRDVLILSGDGLYRMNYADMVRTHRETGADITIAVAPVTRAQAGRYGVMRLGDDLRVSALVEKPTEAARLDELRKPAAFLARRGLPTDREYMANMGVYLVRREALLDLLRQRPGAVDLVTQHFAQVLESHRVQAHLFEGYWQDLGSVRAYFDANLALAGAEPPFDFHSPEGVIYTRARHLPAALVKATELESCLVSDGCVIEGGSRLSRCVIGQRTHVREGAVLRDVVVSGADRYEKGGTLGIGAGAVIENAILDKDVRIGAGARIINAKGLREGEGENYAIRDGIVVVPKGAVIPEGAVI
jgi:glucose-1-phosphate adenylyltransferase